MVEVGDKLFLNVVYIGFGILLFWEVEGMYKKFFGCFSYGFGLLCWVIESCGFKVEICCDKGYVKGCWFFIVVVSGVFFGGGNEIFEVFVNDG